MAHDGRLRPICAESTVVLCLQDVDNNGIIDQTDLMSQSADICIAANTAVEEYYNAEISKYATSACAAPSGLVV